MDKLQTEVQELRKLLDLPPLESLFKRYSPETQRLLGRVWKLYCTTQRPYKVVTGNKVRGGRGKGELDTAEGWSRVSFERFLVSLSRFPESTIQSGLQMYLNSNWVGTHNFDMLLFKNILVCLNRVAEKRNSIQWK